MWTKSQISHRELAYAADNPWCHDVWHEQQTAFICSPDACKQMGEDGAIANGCICSLVGEVAYYVIVLLQTEGVITGPSCQSGSTQPY
jgi:hypothetical protein